MVRMQGQIQEFSKRGKDHYCNYIWQIEKKNLKNLAQIGGVLRVVPPTPTHPPEKLQASLNMVLVTISIAYMTFS